MSRYLSIAGLMAAALLATTPAMAAPIDNQIDRLEKHVNELTEGVISFFGFGPNQANNPTDPQPLALPAPRELAAKSIEPAAVHDITAPAVAVAQREKPRTERGLKKLFCVEYARMRSGLAVFGDAKHWWERARTLYTRLARPAEETVMVFSGSKRLKRGHVAVVTEIVSDREIIVDQANWQNKGEIDLATPVLDVSPANDWSQVRVWDIPSGRFGARTYAISGFIAKGLTRQALNN